MSKVKIIIRILLLGLVLLSLFGCSDFPSRVKGGVINVTNESLLRGTVKLDGEWQFYWNKLYSPKDLLALKETASETKYFTVPHTWNGQQLESKKLSGFGYATYKLIVKVEDIDQEYGIKLMDMATAYNLWVDGSLLASNGVVGKSKNLMRPQFLPKTIFFHPKNKNIELVLQISNFNDSKGGTWKSIIFGSSQNIRNLELFSKYIDLFLFAILLIITIYFIALFYFRYDDKTLLYFGFLCLAVSFRTLILGERIFYSVFPDFNWEFGIKIEHLTMYFSFLMWVQFSSLSFQQFVNRWYVNFSKIVSIIFVLVALFLNAANHTQFIPIFQVAMVSYFIYITWINVFAIVKGKQGSILFFSGTIVLFGFLLNDILYDNNIVNTGYLFSFGLLFFIIIQSIRIFLETSLALKLIDSLKSTLEKNKNHLEVELQKETEDLLDNSQKEVVSAKIKYVISFIEKNYATEINRDRLAELIKISPDYLSRQFNRETNCKLMDFINKKRIEEAKIILSKTDKTITFIAHIVGFDSVRTFNRKFKEFEDVNPQKYRDDNKK